MYPIWSTTQERKDVIFSVILYTIAESQINKTTLKYNYAVVSCFQGKVSLSECRSKIKVKIDWIMYCKIPLYLILWKENINCNGPCESVTVSAGILLRFTSWYATQTKKLALKFYMHASKQT